MQLINATVYLEDGIISRGFVEIKDSVIHAVGAMDNTASTNGDVDLTGYILAPAFSTGMFTDLVVLDNSGKVQMTIIAGNIVFEMVPSFIST